MFTALALLGAAAAAAAMMWLLSRSRHKQQQNQPPLPSGKTEEDPQETPADKQKRIQHEARKSQLIEDIAARIKFSTAPVVLSQVKVGEELVPSPFPADDIGVRRIGNFAELPRMLPGFQVAEDDVFYGQLASGQVLVTEHLVRADIIDDVVGRPVNMLVVLQDVSGSMEEFGRIGWALSLNRKLISRARLGDAVFWLRSFSDSLGPWQRASTSEAYVKLEKMLSEYLSVGGGTALDNALRSALEAMAGDEITCRKLVLITDGTQNVDVQHAKKKLSELQIELHIVCIGKDNQSLRSIAHHYDLFPD